MRVKQGASIAGLSILMRPVLLAAESIWKSHGREEGVTITSGTDGVHSAGSFHYYGFALDFRTHYFSDDVRMAVYSDLCYELDGKDYTVVLEKDHIHVQFNVPEA